MKKLSLLMILCIFLNALSLAAFAEEWDEEWEDGWDISDETYPPETTLPLRAQDECGDNLKWRAEGTKLYITGSGPMDDFDGNPPWYACRNVTKTIHLDDGVTTVGAGAFANFSVLETVEFGKSLHTVGTGAFKDCDSLVSVTLPASFRVFGEESFYSCGQLTEFRFGGSMPSFKLNCLWDTYAKLYYPEKNPWPLEHIKQLEEAFQGRIEFLCENGTDPYITAEDELEMETLPPETEATQPAETTPPETVTETIAPTVPATVTASEATEAVEPTQEYVFFTEPTEPSPQRKSMGGWIGALIVTGTLLFVLMGSIIVRRGNGRGGRYHR